MILIALGSLVLVAAGLLSNTGIEQALRGSSDGSLSWGPLLFRVMLALHGAALIAFGVSGRKRRTAQASDAFIEDQETGRTPDTATWVWFALVGLTVIGAALRFWKLNSCLWYDEIDTVVNILRDPLPRIVTNFSSQNQHMFFSVLARMCVVLFGESPAAVRLPSVIFSLLSLWALFLLGRRVVGVRAGVWATALMTVSYHHVWFAQNARGYMGLLFFTILATWLLIEARQRTGLRWWVGYAIAIALGSWIHMTMVFVAVAQAIVFVLAEIFRRDRVGRRPKVKGPGSEREQPTSDFRPSAFDSSPISSYRHHEPLQRRLRPVWAWVLSGTLTIQLYALGLPEFFHTALHEASATSEWTNPLWVVRETIRNLAGSGPLAVVAVAGGGIVLLLGWIGIARRGPALAWMMVLPGTLAGGTMMALGHNLWPRFFFFCMGFALLLAVAGVEQFVRWVPPGLIPDSKKHLVTNLAMILMVVASAATLPRNYAHPKQDFTGARDFVEKERRPSDGVVGVGLAGIAYESLYAPKWRDAQTVDELKSAMLAYQRLWLVYTLPIEVRAYHPGMWEVIERDFEKVRDFPGTLGAGTVTVCKSK